METLFNLCVAILQGIANATGLTYQQANIWIFVILHPLLTLAFFWLMIKYKRKWENEVLKNTNSI